jgi:hypothetical protein
MRWTGRARILGRPARAYAGLPTTGCIAGVVLLSLLLGPPGLGRDGSHRSTVAAVVQTLRLGHGVAVPTGAKGSDGSGGGTSGAGYGWASSNWSGYAIAGAAGSFHEISGTWVVPAVAPSRGPTYSATWLGIDGFNDSSLIQTGTEQDYVSGRAHYAAWWTDSNLGFVEQVFPTLTVAPGDVMVASIAENTTTGTWTIVLDDERTGASAGEVVSGYTGPGASAEWIVEAPVVNGRIANLANYGTTTFDLGQVNGTSPNLALSPDAGFMVAHNRIVSIPSGPDPDADGFAIAYGSTPPPAPSSS